MAVALALSTLAGGAAFAQGGAMMKSDGAMGAMKSDTMAAAPMAVSAADTKKMKACHAMTPAKMAKDKGCMKMAKMHPDMMKSQGAMASGGMMANDGAMSSDAMMKK
jgi:hypothetical protein